MAPPPELIDDVTAEILLRLPPDEPASLVRAALVCKSWRRILSDRGFLRRYREFHQPPPLLGFLHNRYKSDTGPRFVPTAAASPFSSPAFDDSDYWWTLDCRHGRALFHSLEPTCLIVWDPITGDAHYLPKPAYRYRYHAAAVLCSADGCDHLDCLGGPFVVVFVGVDLDKDVTRVSIYSSETGAWSAAEEDAYFDLNCRIDSTRCLSVGDALYFMVELGLGLVKYDLAARELSLIDLPGEYQYQWTGTLMTAEGGGLGLAVVEEDSLYLWSCQAGAEGIDEWVQHRVISLNKLLPVHALADSPSPIGFAEGLDIIFVDTIVGAFAIELKSMQARKVGERGHYSSILPYMSFYTPDLADAILPPS